MKRRFWLVGAIFLTASAAAQEQGQKSNEELAKELANPNTPLTSVKLKLQHWIYEGDIPDVDGEASTLLLLQPTLPFPLENGRTLWVRPGVPFIFSQPYADGITFARPGDPSVNPPDIVGLDFGTKSGIGDITMDFQYGATGSGGLLWSVGATLSMPTATNGLGTDRWSLGPGFQIASVTEKKVLGVFVNRIWDVAGSYDASVDLTTFQFFGVYLPGDGWSVASSPIVTLNQETDEWTVPVNFAVSKTRRINGRPWKFAIELNYYLDQPDAYGPKWMIAFNVAPVVVNRIASWFK